MPCVLPVLALKVYSLVRQAEADIKKRATLGISFSLGILCSLWVLGIFVYALRAAGKSVGWGFQFQNVEFNLFMIALLSLFAFNLFGLFEINLPTSTSTSAVKLSNKNGIGGAFISGAFMTLLATPCSAPFLGPALGYAFSQDTLSLFLILSLVGIGLALPYFILTLMPKLQRFLPKPGDWMVHFKHFTGFVLLGTALFLIWVLGSFGGDEFIVHILIWVLATGLWSWVFGIFAPIPTPIWRRIFMWSVLIITSFYWFTTVLKPIYLKPQSAAQIETGWKVFDADEIAQITQGKVFMIRNIDRAIQPKTTPRPKSDFSSSGSSTLEA